MADDNIDKSDSEIKSDEAEKKRSKKEKQKRLCQKKAMLKKQRKMPAPRSERLLVAPKWIAEYDINIHGENIIKAYRKHFHVEPICALQELQILEYPLTDEQIDKFHQTERNKVLQEQAKKRNRRAKLEEKREQRRLKKSGMTNPRDMFPNSNDTFFYIAGYTSGGAPYGVTWAEMGLEPYENPDE
jgi:hypothetical protein